jgi:hypothetical protein
MSLMLDRESAPEAEYAEKESFGRTAARVLMLSVMVTALVVGLYMVFGGNSGTDPLAAGTSTDKPAATAEKPAPAKPKPLTYEEKVAKAAAALPKASSLSTTAKRTELIKYLRVVGVKVPSAGAPATAASGACTLLNDGTSPTTLINGIAAEGGYSKAQAKAFLLGASTLYCPGQAKNFR